MEKANEVDIGKEAAVEYFDGELRVRLNLGLEKSQ